MKTPDKDIKSLENKCDDETLENANGGGRSSTGRSFVRHCNSCGAVTRGFEGMPCPVCNSMDLSRVVISEGLTFNI